MKELGLGKIPRRLIIIGLLGIVLVLGYYNIRPLFYTPSYPEDLQIVFKYGVNTRNILNTSAGTYTKDLIQDPPITTELTLTKRELDTIWSLIQENGFYTLEEQSWARSHSIAPEYKYNLIVQAKGYPDTEITMTDLYHSYKPNEEAFFNITKKIVSIIESKPEYKALPKPRGGYA